MFHFSQNSDMTGFVKWMQNLFQLEKNDLFIKQSCYAVLPQTVTSLFIDVPQILNIRETTCRMLIL